jgi:CAAX prenyl protease-like protein
MAAVVAAADDLAVGLHGDAGGGAVAGPERGEDDASVVERGVEAVPLDRFAWIPFLVSSAAFGALHGRGLAGVLAGMLYAVALYRGKSVGAPVLAHATTNALIAVYVLATGAWTLWV